MSIILMFFVIFSEQDHLQLNSLSDLTNSLSQMQEIDLVSIICLSVSLWSVCFPLVCLFPFGLSVYLSMSISLCLSVCLCAGVWKQSVMQGHCQINLVNVH